MNLLLVEDEERVADFLRRGLSAEGWIVDHVGDGESALERARDQQFDVIVLDLMLPGIAGQDVCRRLRARRNFTPILMLSALDELDERVAGLRLGADDYLTKPFEFDELLARLEALVRRERQFENSTTKGRLSFGDIAFDTRSYVVTVAGEPIDLTTRERDILKLMLNNPRTLLSRERILSTVWGSQDDPLTNIVDVYVGRLRKKLGASGEAIRTVRGAGYRFDG